MFHESTCKLLVFFVIPINLKLLNVTLLSYHCLLDVLWVILLGPFHEAIAVPSVTCCRCRRCWRRGHRCAGGAQQYRWRHLVNGHEAVRSSEWAQHFSNASCLFSSKCVLSVDTDWLCYSCWMWMATMMQYSTARQNFGHQNAMTTQYSRAR